MNRPPCCWMIGWYAERPCRSSKPTSAISLASGALPGTVCAALYPPPHSSTTARYTTMGLNHCAILTPSVPQEAAYLVPTDHRHGVQSSLALALWCASRQYTPGLGLQQACIHGTVALVPPMVP